MILWRVARRPFADLSGQGGLRHSGRWHSAGRPVVYTAEHPALALLEVRVHLEISPDLIPDDYVMMKIAAPDNLVAAVASVSPFDDAGARKHGDGWLRRGEEALQRVQSALAPESWNVLINPLHPDAGRISVVAVMPFAFDARLF
ncbi:MAG: RES family NAD+ phosphorylase [Rhizobiaceae bacterium]